MNSDDEDTIEHAFMSGQRADAEQGARAAHAFDADATNLAALAFALGHDLRFAPGRKSELPPAALARLVYLIDHYSGSRLAGLAASEARRLGPESLAKVRRAWSTAIEAHRHDLRVLENGARFFEMHEPDHALELYRAVLALDPANVGAACAFAASVMRSRIGIADDGPEAVRAADARTREVVAMLEGILSALPDRRESSLLLSVLVEAAAAVGEWKKVEIAARALLECAAEIDLGWMHGNAIYDGHAHLGRAAPQRGDVGEAKSRLLAAGRTPGSPQLDTFGPNMTLARELLDRGEREVVLEFLELVRVFWRMHGDRLDKWRAAILDGRSPSLSPFEFD